MENWGVHSSDTSECWLDSCSIKKVCSSSKMVKSYFQLEPSAKVTWLAPGKNSSWAKGGAF